jgi:hypothetical protein
VARKPDFTYRAFFKPDQLAALDKLDEGFDEQGCGFGYTQAFHKAPTESIPFRIPSEFVASKIGQLLGLPIPPCAITVFGPEKIKLFSSLDFDFERSSLVPVLGDIVVSKLPLLCAGVVVFDIFIGNEDRHDENVVVDRGSDPKRIHVFDHDHALLSGMNHHGIDKLEKLSNDIGITGKPPLNNNRHVFLDELRSEKDLNYWVQRVSAIPEFMLDDLCRFARNELELAPQVASALSDFLRYRKRDLHRLIHQSQSEFTSIANWTKTLFDE